MKYSVNKIKGWQIGVSFVLLAFVAILPQFYKQTMVINSWDVPFHLSRMYEIYQGFLNGKWVPDISAYTFGENGYGVNLFYGYSFIYVVALIYLVVQKAVTAVLIGYVLLLSGAMGINYYIGTHFFKGNDKRFKAFLFATIYVLAPATFGELVVRGLPGELIGILMFPAVIGAFYLILFEHQNKWLIASLLSAITLTNHALSVVLLFLVLGVMFITALLQRLILKSTILALIKAAITTFLLSAFYIVPFIQQSLAVHIAGPNSQWQPLDVWGSITASLKNEATLNWTAIPVGTFVFVLVIMISSALLVTRNYSVKMRHLSIALVASVLLIAYAPTQILYKTPLHVFQVMGRFYPIVMTFSTLFVVAGIDILVREGYIQKLTSRWILIIGVFLAISSAWAMQMNYYYQNNKTGDYGTKSAKYPNTVTNNNFVHQINNYYQLPIGSKDYLSKNRVVFSGNYQIGMWGDKRDATQVLVNGKVSQLKLIHEGYEFQVNKIPRQAHEITLPMTNYLGWKVTNDAGHPLKISVVKGKISIKPHGSSTIRLHYQKTFAHKISILLSLTTLVGIIFYFLLYKNWRNRLGMGRSYFDGR